MATYLIGYNCFESKDGVKYVKLWTVNEHKDTVGFRFNDQANSKGRVPCVLLTESSLRETCPALFNLTTNDFLVNRYGIDIVKVNNLIDSVRLYQITNGKK